MEYPQSQLLKNSVIAEQLIFKTLWDRLPKKSFISGLWLRPYINTPLFYNCWMHVLSPKEYPYLRLYFGNLILCTPGEKALYEQCTEESLIQYSLQIEEQSRGRATADWKAVKDLAEDLKAQYKKSFPSTKGMFINYTYNAREQQKIIGELNKKFLAEL